MDYFNSIVLTVAAVVSYQSTLTSVCGEIIILN